MRRLVTLLCVLALAVAASAQSDDELFGGGDDFFGSDDALFGGDDDALFGGGDDDLFADDGIDVVEDGRAKSDLSKGVLFDSGSIKIGGSLDSSLSTSTVLFSPENKSFRDNLSDTILTPKLSAMLSVDARPTETLRFYTKFGLAYPFVSTAATQLQYTDMQLDLSSLPPLPGLSSLAGQSFPVVSGANTSVTDWLKLKELFTDFSVKDTAFFRFGVHTVTWGAGYFFSPVSDMINTSSIDPEHPDAQVDGSLNLRTQIIIPHTQNCLWLYVIPSTDFTNQTASSYARDTALAGKADVVFGGWEFGFGGFYKYQNAPKFMMTATGSLGKASLFGEFVYSHGAASEWKDNPEDWGDKTSIFQATAGLSYYWKEPNITFAAQYYFNGNDIDIPYKWLLSGHNIATMVNFGKIPGMPDFSASLFGMMNFGREELSSDETTAFKAMGLSDSDLQALSGTSLNSTAMLYWSPIKDLKLGLGPSFTFPDFDTDPTVSLKLSFTLGGGKF